MKTYIYKNEIIHEDELKEIELPKVGERFKENRYEKVLTITATNCDRVTTDLLGEVGITYLLDNFQPIPSPPVCPPELLPLPDGAVYCENITGWPKYYFCYTNNKWLEHGSGGWFANKGDQFHYATVAGDACHRSQVWFDESQVPKPVVALIDHTEGGKYRMLEEGDILQEGDEYFGLNHWWKSRNTKHVELTTLIPAYRRPVDPAEQAWLEYDGTANHKELFKAGFNAARKNDI